MDNITDHACLHNNISHCESITYTRSDKKKNQQYAFNHNLKGKSIFFFTLKPIFVYCLRQSRLPSVNKIDGKK